MSYIWPMALVLTSNIAYQICAKSVPEEISPFASLIVTYLMGAAACAVLYFVLGSDGDLLKECGKLNWSSFILGIVIVGLEAGWIYAYKAVMAESSRQGLETAGIKRELRSILNNIYAELLCTESKNKYRLLRSLMVENGLYTKDGKYTLNTAEPTGAGFLHKVALWVEFSIYSLLMRIRQLRN